MPTLHYLNVKQGDCSIIQHVSGHVTVIDVCNAKSESLQEAVVTMRLLKAAERGVLGNFNQKKHPVNPILYMRERSIGSVFRFILTNCDMDHMDGVKDFWDEFSPTNFWDTDNNCEKDFEEGSPYREEDWLFYKSLRDKDPQYDPKRLTLLSGARGQYYNRGEDGTGGGDGLHILAPTQKLIDEANECGDYNDCSYVILYRTHEYRIIFGGDSHDRTWEHVLATHGDDIGNINLLIAPHHGRDSERSYEFLDVLRPKLTFFGNANSEHLAYSAWNSRKLPFITNNQAGCMIVDIDSDGMRLYVTHKPFAEKLNPATTYSDRLKAYYCGTI
jgi:beta-lactamase superfamily II metal-dependent hydrolase